MSCIFSPALQVVSVAGAIKKGSVVVSVGTKKGGFIFHSPDRRKWTMAGPYVPGATVYHFILDPGRPAQAAPPTRGNQFRRHLRVEGRGPDLDDRKPRRARGVHAEQVPRMGPMRPQTRVGRLGRRIDLPAEPLRHLPSGTGRR